MDGVRGGARNAAARGRLPSRAGEIRAAEALARSEEFALRKDEGGVLPCVAGYRPQVARPPARPEDGDNNADPAPHTIAGRASGSGLRRLILELIVGLDGW